MTSFLDWRGIHSGQHIYVIGKGPSLRTFSPFESFANEVCIGVNNVYKYFPFCRYVVFWHKEFYEGDKAYLDSQRDFQLFYSNVNGLPDDIPNGINLPYSGDFPQAGTMFGTLEYWKGHPSELLFKTTFASAVKLAWWMGAQRVTLLGCDFSLAQGRTADDSRLLVDVPAPNLTVEQMMDRQKLVFDNLREELAKDRVVLDRATGPEQIK